MPEEKKRVSIKSLTEELNALKEKVKKVDILEKQMIEMKGVMELLLEDRKKDSVQNSMVRLDSYYFNSSVCNRGFVTKSSLEKHIKGVHLKIKNKHCDQCEYITYSGFNLKLHVSKMHNGKQLEKENFSDCSKVVYNLPYHSKIYHQGNQEIGVVC